MNATTERNGRIKKALLKYYSAKDVTVRGDTGTAYGWVKIKVTVNRPAVCNCKVIEEWAKWAKVPYMMKYRGQLDQNNYRSSYMCENCLKVHEENTKKMNEIVNKFYNEFGTYYADDGYDTEHREVIAEVEVRL